MKSHSAIELGIILLDPVKSWFQMRIESVTFRIKNRFTQLLCRIDHSHIARYNHSGWFSQIELTKIIKIRKMIFIWDFRLRLIGLEFETRICLLKHV